MKKLILEEGFPQILQDYPLLAEQNIKDGLAGFFGALDNVKLSGVEMTIAGANRNISAGWVIFEGEIMRVEAHTVNGVGGGDTLIAQSYEVVVSNNPKPYLNGETKPLVKEKMCRIVKKTTEVTWVDYIFGLKALSLKLAELALPQNNAWYPPGENYTLAGGVDRPAPNPFYLSKSKDGQLRFKGDLSWDMLPINIVAGWRKLLTIDTVGWRPSTAVRFTIPQGVDGSSSGNEFGYLFELKANGELWLKHSANYPMGPLNFGSVNLNIY